MDYSTIDCPQYLSFDSSSEDEHFDNSSYFDTVHDHSVDSEENNNMPTDNGYNTSASIYATPKLVRLSGTLNIPVNQNDDDETLCDESLDDLSISFDKTKIDDINEDQKGYPVFSTQKRPSRGTRKRRLQSWPTKSYNLRFTPSRWQHYQNLMNKNDLQNSAKAALRVSCTHILRQDIKKLDDTLNASKISNGLQARGCFTPRLARDSGCLSTKKKVHFFDEGIKTPRKSSLAFEKKRQSQVTPFVSSTTKRQSYRDVDDYDSPQVFPVKRRVSISSSNMPLKGNTLSGKNVGEMVKLVRPSHSSWSKSVSSSSVQKKCLIPSSPLGYWRDPPYFDKKTLFMKKNSTNITEPLKAKLPYELKSLKTTAPEAFHFKTDERIKKSVDKEIRTKEKDFVSMLRHNTPRPAIKKGQVTKVKPFNLNKRKRDDEPVPEYKTLAQKVEEHIRKGREASFNNNNSFAVGNSSSHLVRPHSPKLLTSHRQRPIHVVSQQEKEEQEIQEMKAYKFHAQVLDPRILKEASHLPRVNVKPSTIPMGVELETEKRHFKRVKISADSQAEEKPYEFHAREVPKSILKGPVGIKEKEYKELTKPKSPAFHLKKRAENSNVNSGRLLNTWMLGPRAERTESCDIRRRTTSASSEQSQKKENDPPWISNTYFKASEAPKFHTPFKPHIEKKKQTSVEPFSFDEKDRQRMIQKVKKVQLELEREKRMREFHANPVPVSVINSKKAEIPVHLKKSGTKPKEFSFHIDKINRSRKDSEVENVESFKFKAGPPSVLKKAPFKPKKPPKRPIALNEFRLSTQTRALERKELEEKKKKLEAEQNEMLLQKQREMEQKQEEELKVLRAKTVHKAQPVKNYKPVIVKPSHKPLTHPCSPKFATEERLMTSKTLSFN